MLCVMCYAQGGCCPGVLILLLCTIVERFLVVVAIGIGTCVL